MILVLLLQDEGGLSLVVEGGRLVVEVLGMAILSHWERMKEHEKDPK